MHNEAHITNMKEKDVLKDLESVQEQHLFYNKQLRASKEDFQS